MSGHQDAFAVVALMKTITTPRSNPRQRSRPAVVRLSTGNSQPTNPRHSSNKSYVVAVHTLGLQAEVVAQSTARPCTPGADGLWFRCHITGAPGRTYDASL